jgi:3-(3-hydroxy-phenyl)propionate hydroxylase
MAARSTVRMTAASRRAHRDVPGTDALSKLEDAGPVRVLVTEQHVGHTSEPTLRLAQKGAKVVVADVSDERGEALAREVGASRTATIERCRSIMYLGDARGGV